MYSLVYYTLRRTDKLEDFKRKATVWWDSLKLYLKGIGNEIRDDLRTITEHLEGHYGKEWCKLLHVVPETEVLILEKYKEERSSN